MAQFKPPDKLNFENPKWEEWKKSFEAFSLFTELNEKTEEIQIATLKYCMGIESEEIMKTFNLSEEDAKCYNTIMKHFDNYFKPKKNIIRLRRIFSRRLQEEQEDIELFLRALYKIADDCSFTDKKERIRDQFVAGIRDEELAEKLELIYLHNSNNFTLETVLEYSKKGDLWRRIIETMRLIFAIIVDHHTLRKDVLHSGNSVLSAKKDNHYVAMCWKKRQLTSCNPQRALKKKTRSSWLFWGVNMTVIN